MDNDADGIQANVNAITDHIGVERVSVYDENNAVGISNQNNKGTDATMSIQLLRALQQFFQVRMVNRACMSEFVVPPRSFSHWCAHVAAAATQREILQNGWARLRLGEAGR